jgi:predicted dehydrogenase
MSLSKKIKWGIIGCGNIANKFANDLSLIDNVEIRAVASRSLEKAIEFGQKHHAKITYGSYDELFLDDDVDIVYIATPHNSHADLSIKAMELGKNVLCEKPLALNAKEASLIIAASKRTNRFFMEALWTRFNPTFIEIKNRIDQGELGEIKYINADFSFRSEKPLEGRVMNLDLGGGSILDIGIYPAFLAYTLLGTPKNILASSVFHSETKCDIQTSMIFEYESAQAILYCSFTSKSELTAKISGTDGQIQINDPWHAAQSYSILKDGGIRIEKPIKGIGFTYEIEECHQCLLANKIESELWSHQNSLDLITILDIVREQVGLKYPQEKN